ncbi:hypothetical protein BASA81_002409 [Batrachochytrium salamandrivorans]|nr:hypothetical protein BASA81_002409 [Batrachochytrium salamandrivorans]
MEVAIVTDELVTAVEAVVEGSAPAQEHQHSPPEAAAADAPPREEIPVDDAAVPAPAAAPTSTPEPKSAPAYFSSVLSPSSLQRLAWYFGLPTTTGQGSEVGVAVDQFIASLPALNEAQVLVSFAKTTRQMAGEDPEELDEQADSKRLRMLGQAEPHNQARMMATSMMQQQQQMHNTAQGRKRKRTAVVEDGKHVAAKIDGGQEWNLMTVLRYAKKTRTYVLEDADEQVEKKDEVEVSKELVIPLSCAEYSFGPFPTGTRVLAMYPGTTSFYFAKVIKCSKRTAKRTSHAKQQLPPSSVMFDYQIQFDEDDYGADGELVMHAIKGEHVAEAPDMF